MTRTIWKFPLEGSPGDAIVVPMPKGAHIIHVADQDGTPTLWAEVDPAADQVNRLFCVVGTGWPDAPEPGWMHLTTFLRKPLVWHVYEVPQ